MIMNQASFTSPTRPQGRSVYSPAHGLGRASPIMGSMGSPTLTYQGVPRSPTNCGYSSEASTESPLMLPARPRRHPQGGLQNFQTPPRKLPASPMFQQSPMYLSSPLLGGLSGAVLAYDPTRTIAAHGYRAADEPLAKTLQGSIWCGENLKVPAGDFNRRIVVKMTSKSLHSTRSTVLKGKVVRIQEDIVQEMSILRYLTQHGAKLGQHFTAHMASFVDFFSDDANYFMVQRHGGTSMFNFVLKAHECVAAGKLAVAEWRAVCKTLFTQMLTFVDLLHSAMGVCHLDLSLENMLINDVMITEDAQGIHFLPPFRVQICDFGLAQCFDARQNPNFLSSKFVGKTNYKSPEIYAKRPNFDARASDVWSLGVCLFTMGLGSMPFNKPSPSDPSFKWMVSGHLAKVVGHWKKAHLVCAQQIDMIQRVFQPEATRIGTRELMAHAWLQSQNSQQNTNTTTTNTDTDTGTNSKKAATATRTGQ